MTAIISDSDELKELFIKIRPQGGAWIPGPGGISLEKGIGSCTGDLLEHHSVLGPFLQLSFLPVSLNLKADNKFLKVSEKAENELKAARN